LLSFSGALEYKGLLKTVFLYLPCAAELTTAKLLTGLIKTG